MPWEKDKTYRDITATMEREKAAFEVERERHRRLMHRLGCERNARQDAVLSTFVAVDVHCHQGVVSMPCEPKARLIRGTATQAIVWVGGRERRFKRTGRSAGKEHGATPGFRRDRYTLDISSLPEELDR